MRGGRGGLDRTPSQPGSTLPKKNGKNGRWEWEVGGEVEGGGDVSIACTEGKGRDGRGKSLCLIFFAVYLLKIIAQKLSRFNLLEYHLSWAKFFFLKKLKN